ncbi:type ISP restriction/modification enzyme [Chromatium okenii]|uniref:type ISP restriction/modification enzyme n=1 Tax=Chromatium okenii TaxID=61644 RepID=UPI0026F17BE6|nr:type ISP restriction/modification enzyme [Chromatium okenii]MBV5309395.1 N-6 DNA methylase [Chromatium okenii]
MIEIQNYWRELNNLRAIAGAENEGALRSAFQNLLRDLGEQQQLILYAEYPFKAPNGANLRADGVLMDRLRLVHGWWEAKDEKDDLEKEIAVKLAKGYPNDNIIFEDTRTAVLLQQGAEIMRCPVSDGKALTRLLDGFFNYELPAVQDFRIARNQFMVELPGVARALKDLLVAAHRNHAAFQLQAHDFFALCHRAIGDRVTTDHVDEMLIQHILTDQIFRAIFSDVNFHQENHLARAIGELESTFLHGSTRKELLKRLEPYFAAIRRTAANAITSAEKQDFLKQVYEDFYSAYNPKDADRLGIVYTPSEAVRFIIAGCDWLAQQHFNKRLADAGLDILDPCTGTGTFIVDLIDYLRGDTQALIRKFAGEIHANEISILPYYISCLNIEQAYYEATQEWREFNGACFVNTLENWGFGLAHEGSSGNLFGSLTDENQTRIHNQNQCAIPVILGNPPYNANQKNENDNNKNDPALLADKRIKETYLAASTAQKTKLYDPYVRFLRWASDRIGERGIVAFISNSSFIEAKGFDGFRKVVAQEFQEIWIINIKGNSRTSGDRRRREGGNVFDDKIRVGVALYFLVRNPALTDGCNIRYFELADFLVAKEKRAWLAHHQLRVLAKAGDFNRIQPNAHSNWLNQPQEDWSEWLAVASKEGKAGKAEEVIFKLYSLGVVTNRDEWVYGFTHEDVAKKVRYFIEHYETKRLDSDADDGGIKFTRAVKNDISKNISYSYDNNKLMKSIYRPFVNLSLYFCGSLNEMQYRQREIFGLKYKNLAIGISGIPITKSFQTLAVAILPDLHLLEQPNFLPLWVYAADGSRHDNITNWALTQFQQHYANTDITKRDLFNYVYAVLHDPRYREKFALNLKAEFPRIPFHPDFTQWAKIGATLIQIHAYFEQVKPFGLQRIDRPEITPKCRLKADQTAGTIEIDNVTTLANIPPQAWQYQLGNRSALEWVLDQYKEKTPKDLTIREHFNTYRFAEHKEAVIELLDRVCQVSVDTMTAIEQIEQLPWE